MALLPHVQLLLSDPDLGAQPFAITRKTGRWQNGRLIIDPEGIQAISAVGIIAPPQVEELQFFPEGERGKDMKVIYTQTMMYVSEGKEVSDEIVWHGAPYKVIRVDRYDDWGFCAAYAAKR